VTVTQDSQLCQAILYDALVNLNTPGWGTLFDASPQGSWVEGADYWQYSAQYLSYVFSALETAAGGDSGLTEISGQACFGGFTIDFRSPIDYGYWGDFGWNDSFLPNVYTSGTNLLDQSHRTTDPATFWYGWKFNQTCDASFENSLGYHNPFDFIWYDPRGTKGNNNYQMNPAQTNRPLDIWYQYHDFMFFSTGHPETDANSMTLFFRGGYPMVGHGMLQLGQFELDAFGNRFVWSLGHDNYNGTYFDTNPNDYPNHWSYYRCRAEGANELVLNSGTAPDQDPNAQARVIYYNSSPKQGVAIMNLSQAYDTVISATNNVLQVLRGMQFNRPSTVESGSDYVILQDELNVPNGTDLYSFLHYQGDDQTSTSQITNWGEVPAEKLIMTGTAAPNVTLQGGDAYGSGNLYLQILSPPGALFTTGSDVPLVPGPTNPPGQTANPNFRKLQIHLATSGTTTICIWMVALPGTKTTPTIAAPAVVPLKSWMLIPGAPMITNGASATGTTGTLFWYQIAAANFPTAYNAAGLPTGLTVNPTSGLISGTVSASGTSSVVLSAANASGSTSATVSLTMIGTPFGAWQSRYFNAAQLSSANISGDTATPAGDGITNLMKYALNLNPWLNGAQGLPQSGSVAVSGSNYLSLTYTKVIAATDVTYTPQVSSDLKTWNSGPSYTALVSSSNNGDQITQTVIYRDLVPLNAPGTPRQFFRLQVTGP
jgi:hypothetical protein